MIYPKKRYLLLSAVIFFGSFVLGLIFNYLFPKYSNQFFSELQEVFDPIRDFNFLTTFFFILFNNSIKIFIGMILGILFGIIPFFFLVINGFAVGLVAGYTYPFFGLGGLILALAPHGVFEFGALFIGTAYAFYLGEVFLGLFRDKKIKISDLRKFKSVSEEIKVLYKDIIFAFLNFVFPLLVLAATIETFLIFYFI